MPSYRFPVIIMKRKVGVVLSGCGFLDGTEISEAVLTLLALDRHDLEAVCMAPSGPQAHVVDHMTGEEVPAFMLDAGLADVSAGIDALVSAMRDLLDGKPQGTEQ